MDLTQNYPSLPDIFLFSYVLPEEGLEFIYVYMKEYARDQYLSLVQWLTSHTVADVP